MKSAADDTWAKLPHEAGVAVERGELTLRQLALLAYLRLKADHRAHEVTCTLSVLAEQCHWSHSTSLLSKELTILRRGGWVHYESRPGQRRPYIIHLPEVGTNLGRERLTRPRKPNTGKARRRTIRSDETSDSATLSEVSSDDGRSLPEPIPLSEPGYGPPSPRSPADTSFFSTEGATENRPTKDSTSELVLEVARRGDEKGYPPVAVLGLGGGIERWADWLLRNGEDRARLVTLIVALDTGRVDFPVEQS